MGKRVLNFFRIWGNLLLAVITVYPFLMEYLIPPSGRTGELTSLFGWSWQTWFILLLVSIVVTLIAQNLVEKYDKEEGGNSSANASNGSQAFNVSGHGNIVPVVFTSPSKRDEEPPIVNIEKAPYIEDGHLNMSLYSIPVGGGEKRFEHPIFIKVMFAKMTVSNHPKSVLSESTAKNVCAKITYYDGKKNELGSVRGRWAGEGKSSDEEIIDLLSNGKPRTLYLAMKYNREDESDLYMYGMETDTSYFWNRHEDESYKIDNDKVVVRVEIIGERVQLSKEFTLQNKHGELQISEVEVKSKSKREK